MQNAALTSCRYFQANDRPNAPKEAYTLCMYKFYDEKIERKKKLCILEIGKKWEKSIFFSAYGNVMNFSASTMVMTERKRTNEMQVGLRAQLAKYGRQYAVAAFFLLFKTIHCNCDDDAISMSMRNRLLYPFLSCSLSDSRFVYHSNQNVNLYSFAFAFDWVAFFFWCYIFSS